jgi:hypothetical protein
MRKLLALVFAASIGFTVTAVEAKQGGPAHNAPKSSGSSGAAKSGQNAASQGAKPTKNGDHDPIQAVGRESSHRSQVEHARGQHNPHAE